MHKIIRITAIAAILLALCLTDVTAQSTNDGKKVKQIRFDREKVTIVYNSGEAEEAADNIVIPKTATGVKKVKDSDTATGKSSGQVSKAWYTLDGRRLASEPKGKKGVYVRKEGNRTRKTIVK